MRQWRGRAFAWVTFGADSSRGPLRVAETVVTAAIIMPVIACGTPQPAVTCPDDAAVMPFVHVKLPAAFVYQCKLRSQSPHFPRQRDFHLRGAHVQKNVTSLHTLQTSVSSRIAVSSREHERRRALCVRVAALRSEIHKSVIMFKRFMVNASTLCAEQYTKPLAA